LWPSAAWSLGFGVSWHPTGWCRVSSLGEKAFSADPMTIAAVKKLAVADIGRSGVKRAWWEMLNAMAEVMTSCEPHQ
jgi:hypothetical protein